MEILQRQDVALWRLSVLGPLCSAKLEHGNLKVLLQEAASRTYELPDGRQVQVAARTVEDWYYAYHKHGLQGLYPKTRKDEGVSRVIPDELAELIVQAKREKPRRSIRRVIRMLERAGLVSPGSLSKSSVHRLLQNRDISQRPVRGSAKERRSFLPAHVGDLWVGDSLHGPLCVAPDGSLRKAYLLSVIDGASRFVVNSAFSLAEGAAEQEYAFKQAVLKLGVPIKYYVDRGPAYVARSLRLICGELKIQLTHAGKGDPEAKGVIERWHRTWREEVEDELPAHPLSIQELNALHWAWLGNEYHARKHDTTGRVPREHYLSEVHLHRPIPHVAGNIDELFLHRVRRKVRKDGTVRFNGEYLEVSADLTGRDVELRYPPGQPDVLPRVYVDGRFHCDTVVLDRVANNARVRHRIASNPEPAATPTGLNPLKLIAEEHYRLTRRPPVTGPFSPQDNDDEEDDT